MPLFCNQSKGTDPERGSSIRTFPDTLVLATHNAGKVREISSLLRMYNAKILSAGELGLPEPEENGVSFVENATLKARAAASAAGLPALADDSGLSVAALDGAPGIHSARWAGPMKDFARAMEMVHERLRPDLDPTACFVCVLALAFPNGRIDVFEGRVHGEIVWPARGDRGFGYDPIFVPAGYTRTFAEMSATEKEAISHRSRAFHKLMEAYPLTREVSPKKTKPPREDRAD